MIMSNKNIWYLPGPFHQYQEDVKALAKKAGLRIIDANVTEGREDKADDTPKVTLKKVEQHLVLVVDGGFGKAELEELIGKMRIESDMVRAVIDGLDAGELEKPEAGELAIRLYDALDSIRAQMIDLAGAREGLAAENEKLRNELAELKAGEVVEVEALKAQLDAAGVTYRANASKESLEKLVADLPKA
jgi:regulator of replication initiation timing